MSENLPLGLLIDFYHGAYGPTIRIGVLNLESARELWKIFKALAQGDLREVKLEKMPQTTVVGLRSFVLELIPDEAEDEKKLSLSNDREPSVRWKGSDEGWAVCAGLVEFFVENDLSGHQYLTEEGVDDALVEVSYKE